MTTRGGCGFGRPLFRRRGEPAVEVVEDGFDGWPQLVGDLLLALALAGAASGLGDDYLEDARLAGDSGTRIGDAGTAGPAASRPPRVSGTVGV